MKALYELWRINGRHGIVTMCIGGGHGIALVVIKQQLVVCSLIAGTVSTPIDKHDPLPGSWFFPR
ncbi:hypothetical protein, partial [Bradyrhizobium campsiandrae]